MNKPLRFLAYIIAFATTLQACKKEEFEDEKFRVYTIKEGEHYCSPRVTKFGRYTGVKFKAVFDSSAKYDPQPVDTRGVNKLYGFSDCGDNHHKNSARFGWEWYQNALQIYSYTYVNEVRKTELITSVPLDTDVEYEIDTDGDEYLFRVTIDSDSFELRTKRGCTDRGGLKYKDGPYFGGHETAPHEIKILLKEI